MVAVSQLFAHEQFRNAPLHAALSEYTAQALGLRDRLAAAGELAQETRFVWRPGQQAHTYARQILVRPYLSPHLTEFHNLEAYKCATTIFLEDEALARQVDTLVGAEGFGGIRLNVADHLDFLVLYLNQQEEWSQRLIDAVYKQLEEYWYSEFVMFEQLTPLLGVQLSAAVQLSDDTALVELSDGHVELLLQGGFQIATTFMPQIGFAVGVGRAAIRSTFSARRTFGDVEPIADARRDAFQCALGASQAINALTMYKRGDFFCAGSIRQACTVFDVFGHSYRVLGTSRHVPEDSFTVSLDDGAAIRTLFQQLSHSATARHKSIAVAVNRLAYARDRERPEDKLVDYVVAAEAVLLDEGATELSFRLALRGAALLGASPAERQTVHALLRSAYAARSKLVHGAEPTLPAGAEGHPMTLPAFVDEVGDVIRRALQIVLGLAVQPNAQKPLVDWDDLLFK
jgi:hypothetical protein